MSKECYIGFKNKENNQSLFGIKTDNRRRHMYIVGKTGMGKTTLLNNMILQDIYNGLGVCFIDPHGDSCEYILDRIPAHRHNDVIYFNPADLENPIGLNILEPQRNEENYLITSTLISVFNKIWAGTWSARMEYILSNTLLTLLEKPNSTLLGVIKLLTDEKYRKQLVTEIQDPLVKNFWQLEFSKFNSKYRQEAISPILNKIGQFFSSELIRNILGQSKSTIDLRQIMDDQKILIVNLSKGRLGEENSNLLGSLLVSKLQVATMSRVDIPEEKRKDFYLYVDEFQNFTTDSFAGILSEARKYRLNLILAHQYIDQLTENGSSVIKNAVFGNVGTVIGFRVGSNDASFLSQEFGSKISSTELINLDKAKIAIKLDLDYDNQDPFLAYTLSPLFDKLSGNRTRVVRSSRQNYTITRTEAVKQISEYLEESN